MFESKNLLANALRCTIHDRLCSAVYYALNFSVGYLTEAPKDREKLLEEWRDLGPYTVACIVVLSTLEEGPDLPHAERLIPWIRHFLRPSDEEAVLPIVAQWLDGEPLAEGVSQNPYDEDMKVSELKRLLSAINVSHRSTAGKIIL